MSELAADDGVIRMPPTDRMRAQKEEVTAALVEAFRRALMVKHADDWDMDTISEAAHICAHAWTDKVFFEEGDEYADDQDDVFKLTLVMSVKP